MTNMVSVEEKDTEIEMEQNHSGTPTQTIPSISGSQASLPSPGEQRTCSSLPPDYQTSLSCVNETQNGSAISEIINSLPNAQPPGSFDEDEYEHGPDCEMKNMDPPSYEEAVKAMNHRIPEDHYHSAFHRCPEHGRCHSSTTSLNQPSCNNDLESELAKSFCSRIVFAVIIFGFAACAIRILYYVT